MTILKVLRIVGLQTLWLSPNSDAGSMLIEETLSTGGNDLIARAVNLPPLDYAAMMRKSLLCLGNSSSFVETLVF